MARNTNRQNIKPVFWGIAPVVVLPCLCGAIMALQGIDLGQLANLDGFFYSFACFYSFGVAGVVTIYCFGMGGFTFGSFSVFSICVANNFFTVFSLSILFIILFLINFVFFALPRMFLYCFAFGCFSIIHINSVFARFTAILKPIFTFASFVKFRKRLRILAFRTLFCYDLFRHGFSLTKKLCLESLRGQSLCDSFYYNERGQACQVIL